MFARRCPMSAGITEMVKIMALCETSAVGIVPHFTGPVATAALVHTMATFSARQQRLQPAGRIVNPLVRYLINS
jgi:L-alanine-DL-glutamate epimerase-like enolase superfamily enzyme